MEYSKIKSGLWLIVLLLAAIALVSWSLNRNFVMSEPETRLISVPVKRGEIEQGAQASGVVIRDEMVSISPASGILKPVAEEKDRVRADTVVAQIMPGEIRGITWKSTQVDLVAERPGVVSFTLDGLERILTPSSWADFSAKKASQLVSEPVGVTPGMQVDVGQPLFRVIDNYRIYVLVFPEPDTWPSVGESLTEGKRCNLRFDSVVNRLCSARVVSRVNKAKAKDDSRPDALLLELTDFPHELYYLRHVRTKIITKTERGLVIPKQALVKGEDGYLVYMPANLGVSFRPVTVVASDESQVICEGLKEGQRVVINPSLVQETGITIWR